MFCIPTCIIWYEPQLGTANTVRNTERVETDRGPCSNHTLRWFQHGHLTKRRGRCSTSVWSCFFFLNLIDVLQRTCLYAHALNL